jgi:hypothetical protein
VSPSIFVANVLLNPPPLSTLRDDLARTGRKATEHHQHHEHAAPVDDFTQHLLVSFAFPSLPLVQYELSPAL